MDCYTAAMNSVIPTSQAASFSSNQNSASISTIQNPPMTKMQQAMALLQQKANSGGSASSSDMYAKASQFKPQSKNKPAFIPVQSKVFDLNTPKASYAAVASIFSFCTRENRGEVERYLKVMIETVQKKGALFTTDWDKMTLPPVLGVNEPAPTTAQPSTTEPETSTPTGGKKRKKFSIEMLEDRGNVAQPALFSSTLKQPKQPKQLKQAAASESPASSPALDHLPAHVRDAELKRRQDRARRFQSADDAHSEEGKQRQIALARAAREKALAAAAAKRGEENRDVIDWDEYTIVGVCSKLEKSYLRLTSAPDPSTVRPLHILRQTLDLLGKKWMQDQNYTYICDQFKSLRQDLTVQRIKNEFTVKVYESHARIALEKGDVGEYNQCQAQLKELYRHGIPGCKDEFLGYRILYMVYTMNRTDQVKVLSELSPTEKTAPPIHHALRVRRAVSTGDYHTLFHLYTAAPNMSVYLMDLFIDRERVKALKTISRAFRPSLSVARVAAELGFIHGGMIEVEACFEYLQKLGTPFMDPGEDVVERTGKGGKIVTKRVKKRIVAAEAFVDTKLASGVFVAKVNEVLGKGVDIKGQIH
ncbi:SAC3/GANP/Nin1/mts3/eIF-3 p25 family-domain-containing protein [Chytriomyces cf. hyalinus JEL632]|nr:SAC3/GANP/Nin1/mts3/eIF-3 p25 family-domain-containing protein [Chytriomyces cf. hyalinus JEL632]